jgi:hypothetical protein
MEQDCVRYLKDGMIHRAIQVIRLLEHPARLQIRLINAGIRRAVRATFCLLVSSQRSVPRSRARR